MHHLVLTVSRNGSQPNPAPRFKLLDLIVEKALKRANIRLTEKRRKRCPKA